MSEQRPMFGNPRISYSQLGQELHGLMQEGLLPDETIFRLGQIGLREAIEIDGRPRTLQWLVAEDIARHASKPDRMLDISRSILFGPMPDAIVDWYSTSDSQARSYTLLPEMYYRIEDLTTVIQEKRRDQGKSLTEIPPNTYFFSARDAEHARCMGLARPIWRMMVQRFHPEWLLNPSAYSWPTEGMFQVHELGEKTMKKRIVGHAVISDSTVMSIYTEATTVGVRGIAKEGIRSLRRLLLDEHPELDD